MCSREGLSDSKSFDHEQELWTLRAWLSKGERTSTSLTSTFLHIIEAAFPHQPISSPNFFSYGSRRAKVKSKQWSLTVNFNLENQKKKKKKKKREMNSKNFVQADVCVTFVVTPPALSSSSGWFCKPRHKPRWFSSTPPSASFQQSSSYRAFREMRSSDPNLSFFFREYFESTFHAHKCAHASMDMRIWWWSGLIRSVATCDAVFEKDRELDR